MAKIAKSILIVIFWISSSKGASFITSYEMTWDNATSNCTVDTPTILFDGSWKNLRVNYNLTGNDDVWVGCYLVATAFHYIGCVKEENITPSAEFDHNTPGFCYSACNKTKFIGVNEKKCFCLNETIPQNIYGDGCTKGCRDQEYIACGSKDSISVYTVDLPQISYNGTGDCLLYQKDNASDPVRSWANCNQTKQIMCTYNYSKVHEIRQFQDNKKGLWRYAMNVCFKSFRLPTSVKELDLLNKIPFVGPSWTGVIRSDAIYSFEDFATVMESRKFGFLNRTTSGSKTLLKFTAKTNMKKHALCKNEITALNSSEKSTSATTSGSGDSVSISLQSSTSTSFIISSMNSSTMKSAKNIKSYNYGIPIGVSVATFLIIIGAVIAVILTKRRGKMPIVFCNIFSSDITPKCTMDTSIIINNVYEGPSDSPYEQIDKVVPQTSMVVDNDVQEENVNYAQVNFNPKQNATKTIGDISDIEVEQDKGVYNTLKLHVKLGDSFVATYDTVEKAAMRLKTQHDTENKSDENLTIKGTDENPYNHLNEKLLKECKTDNAYGVTQDIKKEYGYSRKGHEHYLKDNEDMFNHTSRLQVDKNTFNHSSILLDVASTYNHKDTLPDVKDTHTHTIMLQDVEDADNHTKALQDVGDTYNNTNSL